MSPSLEPETTFTATEVAKALYEAMNEQAREPATSIWASFWDRLTDGGKIPAKIDPSRIW